MNPEPALSEAIWAAVEAYPNRRVPLQVVQTAAAAVDGTGAVSPGWRARVGAALEHLRSHERITFPKTRLDHSGTPPLPSYVQRPPPADARRKPLPRPVWHAELAWAAELFDQRLLTFADQQLLIAVNAWLSKRRGVVVPLRERSLELFGDEKLLEGRMTSSLFGPGRLTLGMLETYLCWPPVERSGDGPGDWLVVENYTTYHSLAKRAGELGFDGQIIWGSGNGVGTRLAALATEFLSPARLYYFGDIDAGGFRIARSAATRAAELGLPTLTAAHGLYRLLVTHGVARDDNKARTPDPALLTWAAVWLGEPTGAQIAVVVSHCKRIVQEAVGTELLLSTNVLEWF